jgi:hypothetical protein
MDMRIHCLKCREAQGQFRIHWRLGKTNLADYFTKHHAPAHHVNIRSEFLTRVKDLAEARSQQAKQGQTNPTYQGNTSYKGVLNLLYERTLGKPTIDQLANNQRREFKSSHEGFFPMTGGRFPSDITKLDSHK